MKWDGVPLQPGDDVRMLYTNPFPHLEGLIPFDPDGGVYPEMVKKVRREWGGEKVKKKKMRKKKKKKKNLERE